MAIPNVAISQEHAQPLTAFQVIGWWELRRIYYNAALLLIGVVAVMCMELLMSQVLPSGDDAVEPIALFGGIVLYSLAANACYTLGWVLELQERHDPVQARKRAEQRYRLGFRFSAALTTAPFWFGLLFWMSHPSIRR